MTLDREEAHPVLPYQDVRFRTAIHLRRAAVRRTASLALLALSAATPYLSAQECPARTAAHIRPSLAAVSADLAGVYRAPWEYVCGGPLTVRVSQSGARVTATVQAPDGCPQAGQVRWTGFVQPGQAEFAVQAARTRGAGPSPVAVTATLADRCTIDVGTGGLGRTRYTRIDGPCGRAEPKPVVVFVGGALDDINRNLLNVFCAYDARWEGTEKLYYLHSADAERVRREVLARAAAAPEPRPVVLVGHSYGGNAVYLLAQALAGDGGVRLLVTLDPVSGEQAGGALPRPPGVREWINVRVASGLALSSCGLAGAIGGAWGAQPGADHDLRFPPDPAKDDPVMDHCKTEQMFLLPPIQAALAALP